MAKILLLEGMLSSSSSDSDIDGSIDLEIWDDIFKDDENHQCCPLRPIPIVDNFMENVVARYTDKEFQENFRLKQPTFHYLLNILREYIDNLNECGRPPIAPEKQLCITLYVVTSLDFVPEK
ncbi:hypothetical protein PV328_012280 [Microctonus aethiopoides]|uniref:Uncharacterized protein n=1 Tax=Microctonus aethiopoides TaxID=144406 RepID=A0AA39EZG0_9HYME|nr:hypothetical protein PV328_012280 [Microctonus aethiopoides]